MKFSWTRFSALPLFDTFGDGSGGGGGTSAPLGAEPVASSNDTPAEPTVIDLDDNALIRVKGQEKPVKYGEHVRGFQSQWTKASQRAAQLQKELDAERSTRQRYEQERQSAQRAPQGQPGGQGDIYQSLRQLPYLTGEHAVEMVQSIGAQIQQRDQVLLGALKQIQKMQQTVGGLNSTNANQAFEGKINGWIRDGGYPAEAAEFAKELYMAYEGDDLDQEFPQILAKRWEQLNNLLDSQRRAKVDAARKAPFVPGRGGVGTPQKPLQLDPRATPRNIADQLWNSMQVENT